MLKSSQQWQNEVFGNASDKPRKKDFQTALWETIRDLPNSKQIMEMVLDNQRAEQTAWENEVATEVAEKLEIDPHIAIVAARHSRFARTAENNARKLASLIAEYREV